MHAPGLSFVGGWGLFSLSMSLVERGGLGRGVWERVFFWGGGGGGRVERRRKRVKERKGRRNEKAE